MIVQDVKVLCPAELREALLGTALHINNAFAPLYNRSSSRPKPPVINRVNRQKEMMAGARRKSADEQAADAASSVAESSSAAASPAGKAAPSDTTTSAAAAAAGASGPLERASSMGASTLHRSSVSSAVERSSDPGTINSQGTASKELVSSSSLKRIIHSRHVSRDNRTEVVEDEDALLALLLEQHAAQRHHDPADEEQVTSRATSTTEVQDTSSCSQPVSPTAAAGSEQPEQAPVLELAIEFVQVQVSSAALCCSSSPPGLVHQHLSFGL
jgi:hypothetical protein